MVRAMLFVRIWRMREKHESGVHRTTGQSRDRKDDAGAASTRRHRSEESEETGTGEGTSPQNVGGWQEKDCCCSAGTLGEDQGSKEITSTNSAALTKYLRKN